MSNLYEQNFLLGFTELCSGTEIPTDFAIWSGISGISCCLGRRCWIDMGTYNVFPNMYVVLVGASGRVRKSTSIGVVEKIISALPEPRPNLIAQKITNEALIAALDKKETHDPTKLLAKKDAVGFVVADELVTFLNRNSYDSGLGASLIQFYDCKDKFKYETRARGEELLENCCLGLLGGSTIDWLMTAIPTEAVGGGLTSRMLFIYVREPAPPVAITTFDEQKKALQGRLVQTLARISNVSGEFAVHEQAMKMYVEEYNAYAGKPGITTGTGERFFANKNLSGYASRRFMHIWKVAMCLSAGESDSHVIMPRHYTAALSFVSRAETFMPAVLELITSSQQGTMLAELHNMLKVRGKMSKQDVVKFFSNRLTLRETEALIETLNQSGQLKQTMTSDMKTFYTHADST